MKLLLFKIFEITLRGSKNMKLNIGCGKEFLKGWENTDRFPMSKEVKMLDVTKFPLPYKNSSISRIRLRNIIEHIPIPDQLKLFEDMYRITKHEGTIWIRVPYGSHWCRRMDHYRGYTYASFERLDSYWFGHNKRFTIIKKRDHPTKLGYLLIFGKLRRILAKILPGELFMTDIIVELKVTKTVENTKV
jgi:SAM-dependent methyltransferase